MPKKAPAICATTLKPKIIAPFICPSAIKTANDVAGLNCAPDILYAIIHMMKYARGRALEDMA